MHSTECDSRVHALNRLRLKGACTQQNASQGCMHSTECESRVHALNRMRLKGACTQQNASQGCMYSTECDSRVHALNRMRLKGACTQQNAASRRCFPRCMKTASLKTHTKHQKIIKLLHMTPIWCEGLDAYIRQERQRERENDSLLPAKRKRPFLPDAGNRHILAAGSI